MLHHAGSESKGYFFEKDVCGFDSHLAAGLNSLTRFLLLYSRALGDEGHHGPRQIGSNPISATIRAVKVRVTSRLLT